MTPQTTANHEIMRTQLTLVGAALLGTGAHAQVQCDYLGSDVQAPPEWPRARRRAPTRDGAGSDDMLYNGRDRICEATTV